MLAALLLLAPLARAQSAHVESRCPSLPAAAYDELDARVLLLLSGQRERPLPIVVCASEGSYVEWEARRFPITGRSPLVDEVVEIIETELRREGAVPSAPPVSAPAEAVAPASSAAAGASAAQNKGTPADRPAARPGDARGGGIALGLETELPAQYLSAALGPVFDFAAAVGPVLLGGREAIRLTLGGDRRVTLMDVQAAVAYGAPFEPGAHVGVVARFGAEWLVVYPEGNSRQAAVGPVADLGLRFATPLGIANAWCGIDGRFRLSPLVLRSRGTIQASDIGGSLTLGVAFVDWSRK